jgi:hypothetical protein
MTDSPYLQRVSELDDLAVGIGKTLIQSLTLIHGAALLAIPAFANQFDVTLRPPMRLWMLGWFSAGLTFVVFAGFLAFFALAARSDENLELWKTEGSTTPKVKCWHTAYLWLRGIALFLIFLSAACLVGAAWTSLFILAASDVMRSAGQ